MKKITHNAVQSSTSWWIHLENDASTVLNSNLNLQNSLEKFSSVCMKLPCKSMHYTNIAAVQFLE